MRGAGGSRNGKALDVGQAQRLHAQDDRRQRRAQDLGVGVRRPGAVVVFRVEPDAYPGGDAAAAAGALIGGSLRYRLGEKLLDLVAIAVAIDARETGVHHVAYARHGERGLGDVGREHDAARAAGMKYSFLLRHGQPAVERQDLRAFQRPPAQRIGGLADFPLAGQEHQNVAAARQPRELVHGIEDAVDDVLILPALVLRGERPVARLDRVEPTRYLDHRGGPAHAGEMPREALRVDRRGGDDELQVGALVGPALQQLLHVAQQEIDVETALVRLVDDERVVGAEQAVALRLREQDAVGHHLDVGVGRDAVGEAHLVAHGMADAGSTARKRCARRRCARRSAAAACGLSCPRRRGPAPGRSWAAASSCRTPSRRTR